MADVEHLKRRLTEIEEISNEQWMAGIEDRKKRELEFHDLHRDKFRLETIDEDTYEKFYGNKKYYGATVLSKVYVDDWIGQNAKDKVFLDYACGNGEYAIKAARAGAKLAIGIDISSASIENARNNARIEEVTRNTRFVQADAENTLFPGDSIDTIICSGVLHHMDLSRALTELRRIIAPGGKILAVEALDYNPAIKLYRHLTPAMRTEWEKSHILSLADVELAKNYFRIGEIRYWHITSILYPYLKPLLPLFNVVDGILTRIPLVRLMAWIFTFEMIKLET
jgi:ubiquinone/menaquinone biosynthesis C-methylase UbiE